jgi:hypothetical protein
VSVVEYFKKQYKYSLKYINWPCLQAGSDSKPIYLPVEVVSLERCCIYIYILDCCLYHVKFCVFFQ